VRRSFSTSSKNLFRHSSKEPLILGWVSGFFLIWKTGTQERAEQRFNPFIALKGVGMESKA
jgi:hypothetical protein